MDKIEFIKECHRVFGLNRDVTKPTDTELEQLFALTEIMLEVNEHMNLTAIKDMTGIILKHYVDSLTVSKHIPKGASVIDVGCGAGFPSLPLAIVRPDLKITALDSTAKRIRYVDDTAKKLGLDNVTAIAARAEELANDKNHRESYDIAVARAVAELQILAELCIPFVRIDGCFISMKALKGVDELNQAKNAIKICGANISAIHDIDTTADEETYINRKIIIANKASHTPDNYPRNFGRIQKKPL